MPEEPLSSAGIKRESAELFIYVQEEIQNSFEELFERRDPLGIMQGISNSFDVQIYLHSEHMHYWVFNDFYLLTELVIRLSISIFKNLLNILKKKNNRHQQFLIQSQQVRNF